MINKYYQALDIKKLIDYFRNKNLIIDQSYQRRKVWIERDRIRLIETILLGYVIPSLYFWDAEIDPNTGDTITHIVDGQQRILSIIDFVDNKYKLQKNHLTIEEAIDKYSNKYFHELDIEDKKQIWGYQIPIVQLSNINNKNEIKTIFYRLNLTDYNLNEQEKRHSNSSGEFADLAVKLSKLEFWSVHGLFNKTEMRRMGDIEFCASLLLLSRRGIISQTTQDPLNQAYDDYKIIYEEKDIDSQHILACIEIIEEFITEQNIRFLKRKSQLYTMFCIADYIEKNKLNIDQSVKDNFNDFVNKYLTFKNATNSEDDEIKKYKLAASEGLNKLSNRMIRFEILKEYIFKLKNIQMVESNE